MCVVFKYLQPVAILYLRYLQFNFKRQMGVVGSQNICQSKNKMLKTSSHLCRHTGFLKNNSEKYTLEIYIVN